MEGADIGRVDVPVLVEVDVLPAIAARIHQIGEVPNGEEVVAAEEA